MLADITISFWQLILGILAVLAIIWFVRHL